MSNVTLPFAETAHYNTRQKSDSNFSHWPLMSSQYYVDDEEAFPPLSLSLSSSLKSIVQNSNYTSWKVIKSEEVLESTLSCDSSSNSSIVWIGSRTFTEATINAGLDDSPIVTFKHYAKKIYSQYSVNILPPSSPETIANSKSDKKQQSNSSDNIHYGNHDNDDNSHYYYHIRSIQSKKRHINKKMDNRKTKSLKLAYQRRITTFLTYHPHNKKLRSLHHHYQRSLIQAQEDLRISKELKERLPPRWYFLSRSGKKKPIFTRVNQYGRLDIKNIHDKKFMQEYNHSKQIRQELKNPYIRQLFFDLTDLAVKKLYWMTYYNYPESLKNETEYFEKQLFGIYYVLDLYWIPYLETKLIPDIKEQWKEDQRKWIRRFIGVLPTSSSRTRRLYIEHDDGRIVKINCLSLYKYYIKTIIK